MKKILIMMLVATVATNINAQMEVDSLGKVEINPFNPPNSFLPTGGYSTTIRPLGTGGILIKRPDTDNHESTYGINIDIDGFGPTTTGVNSNAEGGTIYICGVKGTAKTSSSVSSTRCLGIFGGLGTCLNGAGVYGATTVGSSNLPIFPELAGLSGLYAGYFAGDVRVTGSIYGTVLSPTPLLNGGGEDTTILDEDGGNSVTERLLNVGVLQTRRINNNGSLAANKDLEIPAIPEIDKSKLTEEQLQELEEMERNWGKEPVQTKLSSVSYGLAAEQLKAVYPELVYEDANGNVSINYVEMVPLLVQSIKELKNELAELKGTSPKKAKAKGETTAIEDNVSDVDMVRMDQNKPNPFSESTVITLNIPEQTQKASIFIYDMSGKQVQNIAVSERGETNITVYASDITAGMYIYTLVVDGKVAVTRRMIVSKE